MVLNLSLIHIYYTTSTLYVLENQDIPGHVHSHGHGHGHGEGNAGGGVGAVSYTHLDVYKRQVLGILSKIPN